MRPGTENTFEWPTILLLAVTYFVWGLGTLIWDEAPLVAIVLSGLAIAQQASLQHEALHGHPFRNSLLNEALVFPALSLFLPYRRFRDLHLQHHFDPALTDPYDDPESNYRDPALWEKLSPVMQKLLSWNNTLAGRMIIGPVLGTIKFLADEMVLIANGRRDVAFAWAVHLLGVLIVMIWLQLATSMPVWAYLLAVYLGTATLRIRTFLEHRAHDAFRARTVIIEDRGPLSLLFLNNNFHVVHHMHPQVPWYQIPALYAERKDHFQRRNDGYVYQSYGQIFRAYFLKTKDPVPHPVWPVKRGASDED